MKLFASLLSLFLLPTLLFAAPDAAMQARVAAALASATLSKPAKPAMVSGIKTAICYCDPECTCPCGPDCPCTNGCYVKTDSGVYKVSGSVAVMQDTPALTPHRCTCGCEKTGQCYCPNCSVGCGFLPPPPKHSSKVGIIPPQPQPDPVPNPIASPGPIEWALYLVQYNKALRANKPLLIWVGETCPSCENQWSQYVHARLSEYDPAQGTPIYGPAVIVAKPDGLGGMTIAGQLSGIPSQSQVAGVLNPVQTQTVSYQAPQQAFYYQPQPMFTPMMGGFGGGMMGCGMGGCAGGG